LENIKSREINLQLRKRKSQIQAKFTVANCEESETGFHKLEHIVYT